MSVHLQQNLRQYNVKISFKISPTSTQKLKDILSQSTVQTKIIKNFCIFKLQNYIFTVFIKSGHSNVTRIPHLSYVPRVIELFESKFNLKCYHVKVDNIFCCTSTDKFINLFEIVKCAPIKAKISYNPDRFSGLTIRISIQ